MFASILLLRLKLNLDNFTLKTLLTKKGIDLSPLDPYPSVKKLVSLAADSKTKISDLINEMSPIIGASYDAIQAGYQKSEMPKFLTNKTALTELINDDVISSETIDTIFTYWTHVSKLIKLFGYSDKKVKSLLQAIKDNNKKYTVEDALDAFDLPSGYAYYIFEAIDKAMNDKDYTIGDIPPHLFIPVDDFMTALKQIPTLIADDHVTLDEFVKELDALITTGVATTLGVRTIIGKTIYLFLSPIVKMIPKSSKDVKSFVSDFVDLYDGIIADTSVPVDVVNKVKEWSVVVELLRASLQTKEIKMPPNAVEFAKTVLPYFDSRVPLSSNLINDYSWAHYIGQNSFPYVIAKGDVPIVYAILTTILEEEVTEANIKETVENIRATLKEKLDITEDIKTKVINYLYAYSSHVSMLDPNVTLNDLVQAVEFEPYDPDTIKATIDAFIHLINKYQSFSTYSTTVVNKLKEIKGVITANTKVIDIVKLFPAGDFISSLLSCANTIDYEANETFDEKAAHFNDLVAFGVKVVPTLDAWVALDSATISQMLNAVVTTSAEGKQFVSNIVKALNEFDSNALHFNGNDIADIFGEDYTNLANSVKEVTKIPYSNTATVLYYATLVNFTESIDSLYSLALEASTGTLKYDTIGEAGSQISNQNEKLNEEYNGKRGLSGGAIFGIVLAVLVVIGAVCFAVWFFVFRGQKKESQSGTEQITLV
ncbi:hypothetical protein TVAG_004670 [Trichomonas vaginalis G3]|uniref:Uncharacterized protein n=1 Tax=Trichomonas vaginalis (strain ATCC PRA-98 / G3) TaxID=412133 RepID=A2DT29_TRIV3|nr:hypothetical protein TVAGG3_0648850 [Trichomonas vaginalis G3]EAY16436.1 hypothetical protein TVAG_004670 [Trichomonas vaginalis G3]KAI5505698.1 hypothetical protein TVAGG3_0648850 [Trichomonas vaginalis G3]|eukprot:XP_001328659.1 hypothetical protein [Trichomonas vaginalis G3]